MAAPNIWGVTTDSARHQNSLNSRQAVPDADGRFTVVVSNTDPGVVNWVDPGGISEGIVMLRWQLLTAHPEVDHEPGVTVRKVGIDELSMILSPSMQLIASAEQRHEQLGARAAAYARRFTAR